MAIQATQSTQSTQAAQAATNQTSATSASKKNDVSKEDFLKLLISQLQNQDPLKPLDNQEFAQQLATFNSLEQLIGVNQKLGSLADTFNSVGEKLLQTNNFNSIGLLGKKISTNTNQVNLKQNVDSTINYRLDDFADRVTVDIKNAKGELVRRLEDKGLFNAGLKAGVQEIKWDGKDIAGKAATSGMYTFEINAVDKGGKKVGATGLLLGTVTGVNLDGSEPMLDINGVQMPLSKIKTFING